jgi:catechol 2,3-dioxygenase-like lactoylglutathione lyase family enzyme
VNPSDLGITGIDHLVLRVVDLKAMAAFYCDVLGCTVERELPELGFIQLRAGRSLIDLVAVDGKLGKSGGAAPAREGRNLDHFCLGLSRFDESELRAYLTNHGIAITSEGQRYGAEGMGPSFYIADPEGNSVELKGPPSV